MLKWWDRGEKREIKQHFKTGRNRRERRRENDLQFGGICNSWVGMGGYSVGGWVLGAGGGAVWGTIEFLDRGPLLVSKWGNSSNSKNLRTKVGSSEIKMYVHVM
jgi:hypothetical protein